MKKTLAPLALPLSTALAGSAYATTGGGDDTGGADRRLVGLGGARAGLFLTRWVRQHD